MKNLTKDELENISYDDLAYLILEDTKKKTKITDLFSKVIEILNLSTKEYEEHIADFFELISTDKRFILLEKGFCDLRIHHSHKIVIEEDEDDYMEDVESDEDLAEDAVEANSYDSSADPEDDVTEDDLKDLVVVTEDDENEELL